MDGAITVTSWDARRFDPVAYGSDGNHACLWDIAREKLVRDGFANPSDHQIQAKVNEIVSFHNTQTDKPGFTKINNPNVINDGQTIFVPSDGTTIPAGTKIAVGDSYRSPDGQTIVKVERGKAGDNTETTNLVVYRNDGDGFKPVNTVDLGPGAGQVEITADGTIKWTSNGQQRTLGTATPGSRVVIQNDGNVVQYASDNKAIWASNTQRRA